MIETVFELVLLLLGLANAIVFLLAILAVIAIGLYVIYMIGYGAVRPFLPKKPVDDTDIDYWRQ